MFVCVCFQLVYTSAKKSNGFNIMMFSFLFFSPPTVFARTHPPTHTNTTHPPTHTHTHTHTLRTGGALIKKKKKGHEDPPQDEIAENKKNSKRKRKKRKEQAPTHKDDDSADYGGVVGRDLEIDALVLRVDLPLTSYVCNGYSVKGLGFGGLG